LPETKQHAGDNMFALLIDTKWFYLLVYSIRNKQMRRPKMTKINTIQEEIDILTACQYGSEDYDTQDYYGSIIYELLERIKDGESPDDPVR
jgi:hypothetical protein